MTKKYDYQKDYEGIQEEELLPVEIEAINITIRP